MSAAPVIRRVEQVERLEVKVGPLTIGARQTAPDRWSGAVVSNRAPYLVASSHDHSTGEAAIEGAKVALAEHVAECLLALEALEGQGS